MSLSIIVITFNEEKNIEKCLKSASFANEIIVVDSNSKDKTVEIAKKYTDKVFIQSWLGFGKQKQKALDYATKEWILVLDADEVISEDLKKNILSVINGNQKNLNSAYPILRVSQFCGSWIKWGDWRNDAPIRLAKRNKVKFEDVPVHEKLLVEKNDIGKVITGTLWHYSYLSIDDVLRKLKSYSYEGAVLKHQRGKKSSILGAIFKSIFAFLRSYIFKFGFLDGKGGFLVAFFNAEYTLYRYLKLNELNNKKNKED